MRSFTRLEAPDFWNTHAPRWNEQWRARKQDNPGAQFSWYQHEGRPVNQHIIPILKQQTQDHCSYCDGYPPVLGDDTIDHFQPKGDPLFHHHAYTWGNLYVACAHCQRAKMEQYSTDLLRPDEQEYRFERYFIYNFNTHHVEVDPSATEDYQRRAALTIRIFQFNHTGKVAMRRNEFERWIYKKREENAHIDDFAFRFMMDIMA